MRAVAVGPEGKPVPTDVPEPEGPGELVTVVACGLCGSDVEKIGVADRGTVLGHEVVARTTDGALVALVHHEGCGRCARCRAGHESTCERFREPTIVPGGFAERARARGWVELPGSIGDARGTYVEPLACALRALERLPRGRTLVVGNGFIGRLFSAILANRGDEVFAVDRDPARTGTAPTGHVEHAVVCAPGGLADAADAVEPGGTVLVFADADPLPAGQVYRRELTVLGSRSATRHHMERAVELLPALNLPEPTILPLEQFADGVDLYRRRQVLKVVFVP